jgi:hypothetical protein
MPHFCRASHGDDESYDAFEEEILQNRSLTSMPDSSWTSYEEDEFWIESQFRELQPPKEVVTDDFCSLLEEQRIRKRSHNSAPQSVSFKGRRVSFPNDLVFIKFAPANVIDTEWMITRKIPQSNHRHVPFDRSPSDGVLNTIDDSCNSTPVHCV